MKYALLGIDVDGTLLGGDQQISTETLAAIAEARTAGLRVSLATGRSYGETISIWRELSFGPPAEPIVLIGGAIVSDPDTGRTLYQRTIPLDLGCQFADALGEAGYAAMVIVDAWRYQWEYLLCETGNVHTAQREWFDKMDVNVRPVPSLSVAGDIPNPLRISAVADPTDARELVRAMKDRFDGQLNIHSIVAPNYGVTIIEGFAAQTDKWTALKYVAQGYRIAPARIAAIGDDVNDLAMVRGAGLGAAMPAGPDVLLEAADCIATDGLAQFIRQLVAGKFD